MSDTAYLQGLIDATPSGGTCFLDLWDNLSQPNQYSCDGSVTVSKPMRICVSEYAITVIQTVPNTPLFKVASGGVTITGLTLIGPQFAANHDAERAIEVIGSDPANPLEGVYIRNCTISNWGGYGVYMRNVAAFSVHDNVIKDINHAGIVGLSVHRGYVECNRICNIVGISGSTWGIMLSRYNDDSSELVANPLSEDVDILDNYIEGVANWEGIDTHAGQRIKVIGNTVRGCKKGVAITECLNAASVPTYAPFDCIVANNIIDSGVTDGSAEHGILFTGASSGTQATTQAATGAITGNVIRGHGKQSDALGAAIYLRDTLGLVVADNVAGECSSLGVNLYYGNIGFAVTGNNIIDVWTNSQIVNEATGIKVYNDRNTGTIGGNTLGRGNKQALIVLSRGLSVGDFPGNAIKHIAGYNVAPLPVYDPGHHIQM